MLIKAEINLLNHKLVQPLWVPWTEVVLTMLKDSVMKIKRQYNPIQVWNGNHFKK